MYILIDFFKKVVFKDANKMAFTNIFFIENYYNELKDFSSKGPWTIPALFQV